MSLQVDGAKPLDEQERELQFVETFFVEIIDYTSNKNGNNDVTSKPIPAPVTFRIHLRQIATPADVASLSTTAKSIVFDRPVLVSGKTQRVIGFRA